MKLITTNMYAYNYAVRLLSELFKYHYPNLELERVIHDGNPLTRFHGIGDNIEIAMIPLYGCKHTEIESCPYIEKINRLKEILNNESIR